jgi:hypothetical protein
MDEYRPTARKKAKRGKKSGHIQRISNQNSLTLFIYFFVVLGMNARSAT